MGAITGHEEDEQARWNAEAPERLATEMRVGNSREVRERHDRIEAVLKKTIAADLTRKLTWDELSMVIAFTNNVCTLPSEYELKIEELLQKHGLMENQTPGLNGLA